MSGARIAVVTGATRGLGFATGVELARRGYRVVATGRTSGDLEAASQRMQAATGGSIETHVLDVADDTSVAAFYRWLDDTHGGRVDVLINNAGAIFESEDPATLRVPASVVLRTIDNNAVSAFRMSQPAVSRMNERGYGRVVNLSSGMGSLAEMGSGHPAYRVSKAAINAITVVLGHEVRGDVKINAVCPGWVRTDMGGPGATRSVPEGIAGILWAATLPADGPSGGFFRDGEPVPW